MFDGMIQHTHTHTGSKREMPWMEGQNGAESSMPLMLNMCEICLSC